jgi:hypothetical protein
MTAAVSQIPVADLDTLGVLRGALPRQVAQPSIIGCGIMQPMHIKDIDLNLLRLFDAVYRTRNVSRAAELLDLTQPAASQG